VQPETRFCRVHDSALTGILLANIRIQEHDLSLGTGISWSQRGKGFECRRSQGNLTASAPPKVHARQACRMIQDNKSTATRVLKDVKNIASDEHLLGGHSINSLAFLVYSRRSSTKDGP